MFFNYQKLSKFSTLAFALATPVVGQTSVQCFNSGLNVNCSQSIGAFCSNTQAAMGNAINAQDSIATCSTNNISIGIISKCIFTAWNQFPSVGGNIPNVANCNLALKNVTETCQFGGQASVDNANFLFTVLPNTGSCLSDITNDGD
ncbi:hypothetical protein BDP27DRAFT_1412971 [Rhodocollybia butyracea]|uniref:Glycan binding protein Y3-like domain-containing protein n=1 Tax=Rhodocollybia butyracea TaxID=206335 RepID=A0A9P5Q9Y3_9AGAR|nr:hypothetical protein BDP27DRAFT_1412971 [Rhodocollybia butyracea]